MKTYDGQDIAAGDILLNDKGEYQGVISLALDNSLWLTEPSDMISEVDFGTRRNLLNESTIQLKRYEIFKKEGGGH